jgi:hypothetical protein
VQVRQSASNPADHIEENVHAFSASVRITCLSADEADHESVGGDSKTFPVYLFSLKELRVNAVRDYGDGYSA